MTLNTIIFTGHDKEREGWNFMGCEESFITMKLIWHSYLIFNLDNCAYKIFAEINITPGQTIFKSHTQVYLRQQPVQRYRHDIRYGLHAAPLREQ